MSKPSHPTPPIQPTSDENANGQLLLSIRRMQYFAAWDELQKLKEEDTAFDGEVVSVNRGGVILVVNGLRAFLPGSHLCGALPTEELIGQTLRVSVMHTAVLRRG